MLDKNHDFQQRKINIQCHPTTIIILLEGIQMQIKLEANKYEISVKSFIYISHTYIGLYYATDIFLRAS